MACEKKENFITCITNYPTFPTWEKALRDFYNDLRDGKYDDPKVDWPTLNSEPFIMLGLPFCLVITLKATQASDGALCFDGGLTMQLAEKVDIYYVKGHVIFWIFDHTVNAWIRPVNEELDEFNFCGMRVFFKHDISDIVNGHSHFFNRTMRRAEVRPLDENATPYRRTDTIYPLTQHPLRFRVDFSRANCDLFPIPFVVLPKLSTCRLCAQPMHQTARFPTACSHALCIPCAYVITTNPNATDKHCPFCHTIWNHHIIRISYFIEQ
jgi:hypothetical protein